MTPRRSLPIAFTLLLLGSLAPLAGAGTYDLFAESGDERLWSAQHVPNADRNLPGKRTVVRLRGAGESERWKQLAELGKETASLTHRGSELVVLLEDGDWRFVADSGVRSGDLLPGGAPIRALAGDRDTLWAVGLAPPTPVLTTNTTTTRSATADVERPATAPATTRAATTSPLPTMLYRLDSGRWTPVVELPTRLLPLGEIAPTNGLRMAVPRRPADARGTLARRVDPHRHLAEGNAWIDRGTIRPTITTTRHELLVHSGRASLWAAGDVGAGEVYQLTDRWQGPTPLKTEPPLGPGLDRALASAFGRLRMLYVGGNGQLTEQSFNAEGVAEGTPTQAKVQALPPDPRIAQFVQLGVMVLLMFVMLSTLRRRGSIQEAMRRADKLPLAPILLRFLAGIIDALPLILVPAYVVITSPTMDSTQVQERMNDPIIQAWEGGAAVFYLAYTALAEALFARTLGKAIFGLRVANLDGTRVTARAAVVRNVLRIVDLTLALFPLVMVFFLPLRQRLGDVAAGTLVVRSGVIIPPADSARADDQKDD
jgi:uncharacterized RDD family membrane protein YckC